MNTPERIALRELVAMAIEGNEPTIMDGNVTISPIVCPYCESTSLTWEEAKQHDGECAAHPGTVRADALLQVVKRLEAELDAAREDSARLAWRPIETAPKDGTSILVYCEHGQYVVSWTTVDITLWHVDDNKHGPFPLRGSSPTHWMPLPVPPQKPIDAARGAKP